MIAVKIPVEYGVREYVIVDGRYVSEPSQRKDTPPSKGNGRENFEKKRGPVGRNQEIR